MQIILLSQTTSITFIVGDSLNYFIQFKNTELFKVCTQGYFNQKKTDKLTVRL